VVLDERLRDDRDVFHPGIKADRENTCSRRAAWECPRRVAA
jgi:hypothetical protein